MLAEMYRDVCFASMIANQTNLIHQKRGNFFLRKDFFLNIAKKCEYQDFTTTFTFTNVIQACILGLFVQVSSLNLNSCYFHFTDQQDPYECPQSRRDMCIYGHTITLSLQMTIYLWHGDRTVTLEGKLHSILFYPSAGRLALVLEICHIEKLASQIVASTLWLRQEYRVRHSCQGVIIWCCC